MVFVVKICVWVSFGFCVVGWVCCLCFVVIYWFAGVLWFVWVLIVCFEFVLDLL